VIILLVGGGAGYWIGRSGVGGSRARVEKAEAELNEYKRSVTEHFDQTATHFQVIGEQYRELYEHMATGAHALCEPGEAGKQLLFAPGADASPTTLEEQAAEAVAEAEVRPPIDFAASPAAAEVADAGKVAEETADDPVAEIASKAESAETDVPEETVAETVTQSQPESKADLDEQRLH
jgi:uncharacterized membrane-anchored protein YhcB (DUF1043 family)